MIGERSLKAAAWRSIDARKDWLIDVAKSVLATPEPGFLEKRTAKLISQKLKELEVRHETEIAITGIKGYIDGGGSGPTVAIIGELDSLRVSGHVFADTET